MSVFNIYKVEKHKKEKEDKLKANLEIQEALMLKKRIKNELMTLKYRNRIAQFVTEMAENPTIKQDEYTKNWRSRESLNH